MSKLKDDHNSLPTYRKMYRDNSVRRGYKITRFKSLSKTTKGQTHGHDFDPGDELGHLKWMWLRQITPAPGDGAAAR